VVNIIPRSLTVSDYYKILGLEPDSTIDEIKKAYRIKAREFHPDHNSSPGAKDIFIQATEAYEFLLTYRENIAADEEEYNRVIDEWRKYRQDRSRNRANVYAHASYSSFKSSNFYKTTRIFDGTTIVFSLFISVLVLLVTVVGYIYRIHHPIPGLKNPSIAILVTLIMFGMLLFVISYIYLKAYIQTSAKNKK
jgi:hypothetical protein